MSLLEEIKGDKDQLEEALKAEAEEPVGEESAEEEDHAEEVPVEEKVEEEKKPVEEKKEEVEEKPDDAAFARLRREAAANKRLAEDAKRENEELKKPKSEEAAAEEITLPAELQEVVRDHQMNRAEREFRTYESKIKEPDYSTVSAEYANALAASIRIQNPRLSSLEIADLTKQTLLQKAGKFAREGYENPVAELYHEAKELGFTGKSMLKPEATEEKPEPKPDMKKVAENRKRSAGMTGVAGREDGLVSKKTAAEMTPAEWKALDRAERARLMSA